MIINVKVKTNSSKSEVVLKDDIYIVGLHSSPEKGKANSELITILSKYFSVAKSQITIIKGEKSRKKIVVIE